MFWLISADVAHEMQRAIKRGIVMPTAAQQAEYEQRVEARERGPLTMSGKLAEIRVEGVLTKRPSLLALLFGGGGGSTYAGLQAQLAAARNDPNVEGVLLHVDSPGGHVDGLFETLAAIDAFKSGDGGKPITVRASNAQSAAYAIAAKAGPIEATNPGATFGSIGAAASFAMSDDVVTLTNTDSPEKRPDLSTDEGKASVVRHLDAVAKLFAENIAEGRSTAQQTITADDVLQKYGRGATLLAAEAQGLGMVDSIAGTTPKKKSVPKTSATAADAGAEIVTEQSSMDLETLKKTHPDVYAAAVKLGADSERQRVCAHLTMGTASGDLKTAHEAIQSGAELTIDVQAKYLAAGMNRADRSVRQTESNAADVVTAGAAVPATPAQDLGDLVVAALEAERKDVA